MSRRRRARFGATITRRPPLPYPGWDNTNMILRDGRVPYQRLPEQPVPIILGGQTVVYAPYPSPLWNVKDPNVFPNPNMGLRGYGRVPTNTAKKKFDWESFGVGLAAAAGTVALGVLTAGVAMPANRKRKGPPSALRALSPFVLPALGSGVLAYLLRREMAKGDVSVAPECPECPECRTVAFAPAATAAQIERVLVQPDCPQSMIWDPDRGICVAAPGTLI